MNGGATQVFRVRTPEGVAFSFRLASPVLRAGAFMIDLAAISATWSFLSAVIALLNIVSADFAAMAMIIGYFLLSQGYSIATEWLWRGQSVGKRALRLRVVDARGLRLTFSQVLMRNVLRVVDGLPMFYLVGGITAFFNRRAQRLGDIAAGTLVIWQPSEPMPDFAVLRGEKYNSLREHSPVVGRLRQAVSTTQARAAWQALARRDEFDPAARVRLFSDLAAYFARAGTVPPDLVEGMSPEQFVRNVVDVLYVTRG